MSAARAQGAGPPEERPKGSKKRAGPTPRTTDLYCLDEIRASFPGSTVFVTRSREEADCLRALEFVATCCPAEAIEWREEDAAELEGRRVAILSDDYEFALVVASSSYKAAASVRIVKIPGLEPGRTVVDWVEAGGKAETLNEIVGRANLWHPAPRTARRTAAKKTKAQTIVVPGEDCRPEIIITTAMHEVIDQAEASLEGEPDLYSRNRSLVRVLPDKGRRKKRDPSRPAGSPVIVPLEKPTVAEWLARVARWRKEDHRSKREPLKAALPPSWVVEGLMARQAWGPVRHLEGVIEAPTIRTDGSIIETPGWDEETGLLYSPNADFPAVPKNPRAEDARRSAEALLLIVQDFPFKNDSHRHAWLAALLTLVARWAVDGPVPLFAFDGNCPGSGKTLLCDTASIVATGRGMPRMFYPPDEAEMGKSLLAIALAGDLSVLFDNRPTGGPIGGAALDLAVTASTVRGRILGVSKMSEDLPFKAVVFATGNNMELAADALRRVILSRLESPEVRPEERSNFRIEGDLLDYVRGRRTTLLTHALTILRAHAIAGRPRPEGLVAMDFRAWDRVIRSAVVWATGVDPCETRKDARAADQGTSERRQLVEGWKAMCTGEGRRDVSAAECRKILESNPGAYEGLRNVLMEWSRDDKLPGARTIGNKLKAIKGRATESGTLEFDRDSGGRGWHVRGPAGGGIDSPAVISVISVNSLPSPRGEMPEDGGEEPESRYALLRGETAESSERSQRSPGEPSAGLEVGYL